MMLGVLIPRRETSAPWSVTDPRWYAMVAPKTMAGPHVNADKAMTYSAVYAATRGICGTLGRMPFCLRRRLSRGWEDVDTDPRAKIFDRLMNPGLTSFPGRVSLLQWQINEGNGVAEIQRNTSGDIVALYPIHPSRLYPKQDPGTGMYYYGVRNDNAPDSDLMPDEVFHVRNWETDVTGFWGIGVITRARENIGTGLAAEQNRANQFGSNNIPAIVVETPKKMATDDRVAFRKEWKEVHNEGGASVGLLTDGATAKALHLNNRDMQHLELSYFSIEDMSRWYGIPVHMLAHLLKSSQNNIEHLSTEFVQQCLSVYAEPWEQEADVKLLSPEEEDEYDWEFKWRALLRGDNAARTARYQSGITLGWLTRNEAREEEGYNPLDGGDDPLVQGAMIPADQAGNNTPAAVPADNPDLEVRAAWVQSVAGRMASIESRAMKRLAEKPASFCVKSDEFYRDHAVTLLDAFRECCSDHAPKIVETWIDCSKAATDSIADTHSAKTLAVAIDEWAEKLTSDRPAATVKAWRDMR